MFSRINVTGHLKPMYYIVRACNGFSFRSSARAFLCKFLLVVNFCWLLEARHNTYSDEKNSSAKAAGPESEEGRLFSQARKKKKKKKKKTSAKEKDMYNMYWSVE